MKSKVKKKSGLTHECVRYTLALAQWTVSPKIVGWVEQSETQQKLTNVWFILWISYANVPQPNISLFKMKQSSRVRCNTPYDR